MVKVRGFFVDEPTVKDFSFTNNCMNQQLLQPAVQKFIIDHENDDEKMLVLKHKTIEGVPAALVATQINGRKKAKLKIPQFYSTINILYPPGINLEQSSSEKTALFKASVLKNYGSKLIDLTGGYGVDSFFFSQSFNTVHYVEPDRALLEIVKHNHQVLGAHTIFHHNLTAEKFLAEYTENFDCAYIDPSRRSKSNQKVHKLSDCDPDISQLLPEIFKISPIVLIKSSPLLDIHQGLRELMNVEKVWIVAVDNECKEILFLCRNRFIGEPEIIAVNLQDVTERFSFMFSEEKGIESAFSNPLSYIYEPNASILKAGAFKLIGNRFSLCKLHPSTHLYTSPSLIKDFPGRIFKILHFTKPDKKLLHSIFAEGKANIITRNYPLSNEALKKKTKLKDGGDCYLIGFSGQKEKYLVAANRIK
jgi:hypothetical protein